MTFSSDANWGVKAACGLATFLSVAGLAAQSPAATPSHWHLAKLHSFSGGRNGGDASGPLVADEAGNIFGTAERGGISDYGVLFELSPNGDGSWSARTIHRFQGSDGAYPYGGLAADAAGNLYGTTFSGGDQGGGVAFELSPGGKKGWSYSVLYNFGGADSGTGSNPNGHPVVDASGKIYGTTQLGGTKTCTGFPGPCGVAYELTPAKGSGWAETVLYSFGGPPDGSFPYSPLLLDLSGNIYGTTSEGGTGKCTDGEGLTIGCGTVFELTPSKGSWNETILYNFTAHEQNGPGSPLVVAGDGSLFGTAGYDVFQLQPAGAKWKKNTIYEFTEGIAGTIPSGGVVFDPQGNLYGTSASSGLEGYSTAFELSPPSGKGSWTGKTLARFGKGFDSNQPHGGVLIGSDGALYGATSNTVGHGYVFALTR